MDTLTVEILACIPTTYFPCQSCELVWQRVGLRHKDALQLADYLPVDMLRAYQNLSDWIVALVKQYGEQVRIRFVDVTSIDGFIASLRYRVRRYPAAVNARRDRLFPADLAAADALISRHLAARASTT